MLAGTDTAVIQRATELSILAAEIIDSGKATETLEKLIKVSQE